MKKTIIMILVAFFASFTFAFASQGSAIEGTPISISVTADGTQPFTYQWKKDGVDIPGATAIKYHIATVKPTDAGIYTVTVTNSAGSTLSDNAVFTLTLVKPSNVITTFSNE